MKKRNIPITISIQGEKQITIAEGDRLVIKLNKGKPEEERPSIELFREWGTNNIDITIFKYPGAKIILDDDASWKTTGITGKEVLYNG